MKKGKNSLATIAKKAGISETKLMALAIEQHNEENSAKYFKEKDAKTEAREKLLDSLDIVCQFGSGSHVQALGFDKDGKLVHTDGATVEPIGWRESVEWLSKMNEISDMFSLDMTSSYEARYFAELAKYIAA